MKPPFTPKQPAKPVQTVLRKPVKPPPPAYRPNPVPKVLQLKPRPGGPSARPSQTIQRAEHGAAAAAAAAAAAGGGGGGGGGGPMPAAGRGGPLAFAPHGPMGAAGGGRGGRGGRGGGGGRGRGGGGRGRGDGGDGPAAAAVAAAPVAGGGGGPMVPAAPPPPPPAAGGRGRGVRGGGGGGGGGGGARPTTVDVYRKEYARGGAKQPSKRASARKAPYGGVAEPASARLKARVGAEGGGRPGYCPPKDSTGLEIWNGSRQGLTWSDAIIAAMAPSKGGGCQVDECDGAAEGIDHKQPFSELQTGITRYLICDGKHHWEASYKADAVAVYNNNDDPSNMRWSCTGCNSSKGGVKGRYENQPKWAGPCPGASQCNYVPRGREL